MELCNFEPWVEAIIVVCLLISAFIYFFQVFRTALSNRLAKVQGFLFRAAFLRRVPTFFRLIFENIILCFLQSTLHSTSKYITGTLSLRFRKILTKLIHAHYFEVVMVIISKRRNILFTFLWFLLPSYFYSMLTVAYQASFFPLCQFFVVVIV